MLYVFECMAAMFLGDARYVLNSTGEAVCGKDIAVGFLGWFTIIGFIVGLSNLVAFLLYNKEVNLRYVGLKQVKKKYFLIISIIFLALCATSIVINVFVCCFA